MDVTSMRDIETVTRIMGAFRLKRTRWMRDHKTRADDDLPASLSRESEALCIVTALRTGEDQTQQFIGHHN